MNGEEEFADDTNDTFNFAEAVSPDPLDEEDVHDKQDEEDDDHENSIYPPYASPLPVPVQKINGTYEDKRDKDISVQSREEPSNDGHDADGDAGHAEESDGRGDSHLAAEPVALQSELVQHVAVSLHL